MAIKSTSYVKSYHRVLSAICIQLSECLHTMLSDIDHRYEYICIARSARYAPSSMSTFVHNLTKLKFAGTEKKWPNLRGRAVEVRALTQPICKLWATKADPSDRTDVLIKLLLVRSCEFDQVVIDYPDVPRLDNQVRWLN